MMTRNWLNKGIGISTFAVFLFPVAYLLFKLLYNGIPDLPTAGDGALLEMSTRDLFSRRILLGPYSRFLFFHPGPLYFLIRFPFYAMSGERSGSFLLATIFILVTSIVLTWRIFRRNAGHAGGIVLALVFAFFISALDKVVWLSDWNPYIIMFPIALFITASTGFANGDSRCFYALVISGSLVAQSHIGGIPLLAGVFLVSVLFLVYPWFTGRKKTPAKVFQWKHVLIGSGLAVVLWAPSLYEQFTEEKGNMTVIREFFEDNDPEVDSRDGLEFWSRAVTTIEIGPFMRHLREEGLDSDIPILLVGIRVLLLSVFYGLLRRRRLSPFLSASCVLLLVAHAVTLYSVYQIRGPVNDYLIQWMCIIAPLSHAVIILSFIELLRSRLPLFMIRFTPVVALVPVAVLTIGTTRDVSGYLRKDLDPSWVGELAVNAISTDLSEVMDSDPGTFYALNLHSPDCWSVMVGLMNSLEKQGYSIGMTANPWFKDTPAPQGMPVRIFHIGVLSGDAPPHPSIVSNFGGIGIVRE